MNHSNIRLRAIEPEDLDILYEIENDRELWDVGATNVPYSRYSLHNYIATQTSDIYADRQLRLMIENEEGQTVGIADLMNFDPRHRRAVLRCVALGLRVGAEPGGERHWPDANRCSDCPDVGDGLVAALCCGHQPSGDY